ncbi:carboxylesterase/lipase family protein [Actinomadura xylanilytica]|uniref:carboxylesterase/lipase family protein n=1 Tax=Actinomadura xylanilytica TaxID=887459 RepID=UPI00255A7D1F|nr:carboxylesterase family protein [Actinomadura xylanilytica]MDL4772990.1 carboxylesterase family protein [Actinomadura xylanilytica]
MVRYRLLAAAVALVLPILAVPAAQADSAGPAPVVRTDHGFVRGTTVDGVDTFLGIPFAAPPIGDRRFAAPVPASRWNGVRQTAAYGPACAQLPSGNGPRSQAEDCLYANVFRPAGARGRLPVLFYLYGGGLQNGGAQQYDGAKLAADNNVIVVTANYRLNVFGLLALAGSGGDGLGGDYALLDQQAALRWTRANAAGFGGDPRAVTIGGESAGAISVCAHLAAPGSAGLFRAAIMESGSCVSAPLPEAEPAGAAFARSVGCTDPATVVACLRAKPAGDLLDASARTNFGLVSGGSPLPTAPADAVAKGHIQRVPMIFGANHDEGRTFALGFGDNTPAFYEGFVAATFGARAPEVFKRYPLSDYSGPYAPTYALAAILTDAGLVAGIGGCPTLALARRFSALTRVHMYQFDDRDFPGLTPGKPPGYDWGAPHAGELPYLFPSFDNGTPIAPLFTAAQRRLADDMSHYWGSFVRRTTPDASHLRPAPWPALPSGAMLSLRPGGKSTPISLADYRAQHQCDFWDAG